MGSDNANAQEETGGRRWETDVLAELILSKQQVLERLRELSRCQADLIGGGDMTKLLAVLSSKQKLLTDLQHLQRRLDPFRAQDPDRRQWRSPSHRQESQRTAQRCESLLGEIMLIEKQCESELVRRRDQAASQLQGAHTADQARRAYTKSPEPLPQQLDLTCDG